jgi:predicted metal-dependent enzyme (double-stranded beta helix superfamily)
MTLRAATFAILAALPIGFAPPLSTAAGIQSYSNLTGRVLLENERVLVQAFTIQPGQRTGSHTHHDAQLLVFVKGGVLKSESGRATLWKDGRVQWLEPSDRTDEGSSNAGQTAIELREVTLKPVATSKNNAYGYLSYPNVPSEDLLENDRVIVQHFVLNPGQWEGVHGHNANTLYIFIKGGHWLSRATNPPSRLVGNSPDGDVGWMPAIDISAGHESGNTGSAPSDVVWIALKQ